MSCDLANDGQNVVFRQDEVVFSVQLDFRAAVLGNKNVVARLHGEFNQGALVIAAAGAYGDPIGLLGFFLGGVRLEQAAGRLGISFAALAQHTLS